MISKWNQSSNGEVIKENENMLSRRNIAQSTGFFGVNEPWCSVILVCYIMLCCVMSCCGTVCYAMYACISIYIYIHVHIYACRCMYLHIYANICVYSYIDLQIHPD